VLTEVFDPDPVRSSRAFSALARRRGGLGHRVPATHGDPAALAKLRPSHGDKRTVGGVVVAESRVGSHHRRLALEPSRRSLSRPPPAGVTSARGPPPGRVWPPGVARVRLTPRVRSVSDDEITDIPRAPTHPPGRRTRGSRFSSGPATRAPPQEAAFYDYGGLVVPRYSGSSRGPSRCEKPARPRGPLLDLFLRHRAPAIACCVLTDHAS